MLNMILIFLLASLAVLLVIFAYMRNTAKKRLKAAENVEIKETVEAETAEEMKEAENEQIPEKLT